MTEEIKKEEKSRMTRQEFEEQQQKKMREFAEQSEAEKRQRSEGTPMNEQQLEQVRWNEKTMQPLRTVTEEDLAKQQAILKEQRLKREKEQIETAQAREQLEKTYWDSIIEYCASGTEAVRKARCDLMEDWKGLHIVSPMRMQEREQDLITLRWLCLLDKNRKKPGREDYMMNQHLFDSHPVVKKADVNLTRKIMFPPVTPGGQ
jgi:hypothetical protein